MATFDTPNVSVSERSNEENIQAIRNYLFQLSDNLNFHINNLETRVSSLEARIAVLEKGE